MQSTLPAAEEQENALSVSRRARVFVVLVCVAIAGMHAWQSWNSRAVDLKNARTYSGNIAKALAQHAYDSVQAIDGLLLDVSDRIAVLGLGSPLVTDMKPVLHRISEEMPQIVGLVVLDELGNRVVDSYETQAANANSGDRPYFTYHRDHPGSGLLVGKALFGRGSGRWIVPVSRRINHRDGSFAGVVLASMDLDYFTRLYGTFDIGRKGSIGLLLRDGTLLTRWPYEEKFINTSFADSTIFRELLPLSPSGTYANTSRLDGVQRLLSYEKVQKYPLVVTVALAQEQVLAKWRQETIIYSGGVLVLLVMIASFGWRLIGQIELRVQAERKALQAKDELQELNDTLEKMAHQDGLTGLSNRRHFDEMLEKEYRRATRGSGPLSLVLIDVDFFKQYNDIYGHQAGDECLRQIGRVLKDMQRRPADMAVRYGGEEMLMLLPGTDAEGAAVMAERIRAGIQALAIAHRGNPVGVVTVSAGVNTISPDQQLIPPMEALVGRADAALYEAKHGGRNQVRIARPAQAAV